MSKFLKNYKLSKLNQDEIDYLNSPTNIDLYFKWNYN